MIDDGITVDSQKKIEKERDWEICYFESFPRIQEHSELQSN